MPSAFDLTAVFQRGRLDALLLALLALAAAVVVRRTLRRHGAAGDLPAASWICFALLLTCGAALAEVAPTSTTLSLARLALLGFAGLAAGLVLAACVCLARTRAELRAHADIERQLQQAKNAADDANRAKSAFLAVMSHEIRTPLNAVMGFASLLAETRLDDAQRGYLSTITGEGRRLGSLINDILDLTKIEEGRLALERLPFAPAETTREVLQLLGPRAAEKNVELRLEAQIAGGLLVAGDPLRFRQILLNLVDNAVKFTPRGSVTVFLAWTPPAGTATHGELGVRVRDTGIGINPAKLKDLFQMFMQVDSSTTRRYGGTGLGLAICQRLVTMMGGDISVRSTLGEGSEFAFTIPLAQVALPAPLVPEPEPAAKLARTPRILIVDDMETNRFLLEVFLRRHGFSPEVASGGEEAVRLAAENRYDAILMDLQMPDIDGYTAVQRIRAAEPTDRRTPIVALTATIAKGTRERCLAAGMDEHLTKPLDLRRFKTLLSNLLAQHVSAASKVNSSPDRDNESAAHDAPLSHQQKR